MDGGEGQLDVEGGFGEEAQFVEEAEPDHDEKDRGDVALVLQVDEVVVDQIVDHDDHAGDVLDDVRYVIDVLDIVLEAVLAHLFELYADLVGPRVKGQDA